MGERVSVLVVGDVQPHLTQLPEVKLAAYVGTLYEAVEAARTIEPAVVMMSLELLDRSEADATKLIRAEVPEVAVLLLGAEVSDEALMRAVDAGACGFVSEASSADELSRAIRRADEGEFLLPAATMARLLASRREASRGPARAAVSEQLTGREREVLRLMASGLHNSDIAARLGVGYGSVRSLVRGILEKVGARSRLQAVALARESRLIES